MSKGSKQRPRTVDQKTFDDGWDRIFGKKKAKKAHEEEFNNARFSTVTEKPVDSKEKTE